MQALHDWVYQTNREYRCSKCGLIANKDTMEPSEDEICPQTGDMFDFGARERITALEASTQELTDRLDALETPPAPEEPPV